MAKIDETYELLCRTILLYGAEYPNVRRNCKRFQIPSYTLRHDFSFGFPALTTKQLFYKSAIGELIWFLRGDNNIEWLKENNIGIWDKDAYNWHKAHANHPLSYTDFVLRGVGSVGQNYSKQWRAFNGFIDQIKNLINGMQKDIMGSRLVVTAWNPSELHLTALPPCHDMFQVIGVPLGNNEYGFELHWDQRSTDVFLGLPFDIVTFATLAKILEAITGFKALAIQGALKCVHFYDNQLEAVEEQLSRSPYKYEACELEINRGMNLFFRAADVGRLFNDLEINDFKLKDYKHYPPIHCEMLAPEEL